MRGMARVGPCGFSSIVQPGLFKQLRVPQVPGRLCGLKESMCNPWLMDVSITFVTP